EAQINAAKDLGLLGSPEAASTDVQLSQLDPVLLARAIHAGGLAQTPESFLLSRRLAEQRNGSLVLSKGAVWLFAREEVLGAGSQSGVRIARVDGGGRAAWERPDLEVLARFEGNLLRVFDQSVACIEGRIRPSPELE